MTNSSSQNPHEGQKHGSRKHGGKLLIDQLAIHGVDTVFQLPGESFLAALDGLVDHPEIRVVTGRQEGGVAIAAEAYAKVTGKPGIAFVTRAPGACNAASGVHIAFQDSTPMILFVGQIDSRTRDREPFQDMDYRQMFGPLAKWVTEIEQVDRIPEIVSQAFHRAVNGRPGPVVISLPEDMLSSAVSSDVVDARAFRRADTAVSGENINQVRALLSEATSPLILFGGGVWSQETGDRLASWAARNNIPLVSSFRCLSHVNNHSPAFVGEAGIAPNPKLIERVKNSDCLLVLGARLGEMTTSNWTLLDIPAPKQTLIHVYPSDGELGRIYQADLPLSVSPISFVEALCQQDLPESANHAEQLIQAREDYLSWREPVESSGDLRLEDVMQSIAALAKSDAIITTGAGNYTGWVQRYHQFSHYLTQLGCTSGSMGYSIPAAVAAKVARPHSQVIAFAGDGCFQMNSQELATLVEERLGVVILVINNGQYGTIRMHQAKHYPGRISGTQMVNPDFAALARAHGALGATITQTEQFEPAFSAAQDAADQGQTTLLELQIDPDVLSTTLRTSTFETL